MDIKELTEEEIDEIVENLSNPWVIDENIVIKDVVEVENEPQIDFDLLDDIEEDDVEELTEEEVDEIVQSLSNPWVVDENIVIKEIVEVEKEPFIFSSLKFSLS